MFERETQKDDLNASEVNDVNTYSEYVQFFKNILFHQVKSKDICFVCWLNFVCALYTQYVQTLRP